MADVAFTYAIEIEDGGAAFVVVRSPLGAIRLSCEAFDYRFNCVEPIRRLANDAARAMVISEDDGG